MEDMGASGHFWQVGKLLPPNHGQAFFVTETMQHYFTFGERYVVSNLIVTHRNVHIVKLVILNVTV